MPGSCSDPYNIPDITEEIPVVATTTASIAKIDYLTSPSFPPYTEMVPTYVPPPFFPTQNWTAWSDGSQCSKMCGGGLKARQRLCLSMFCSGNATETAECNMEPCPTAPNMPSPVSNNKENIWSEWSTWSACKRFLLLFYYSLSL